MKHSIDAQGNLVIKTQGDERRKLKAMSKQDGFCSDEKMVELFEEFIANSEYEWISPEDIGALTDAPILATHDEEGNVIGAYGFMDYQVVSVQETLLYTGTATFTKAN